MHVFKSSRAMLVATAQAVAAFAMFMLFWYAEVMLILTGFPEMDLDRTALVEETVHDRANSLAWSIARMLVGTTVIALSTFGAALYLTRFIARLNVQQQQQTSPSSIV